MRTAARLRRPILLFEGVGLPVPFRLACYRLEGGCRLDLGQPECAAWRVTRLRVVARHRRRAPAQVC